MSGGLGWADPEGYPAGSLPHSRACGWREHDHGSACHSNCPTCHGRALDVPAPEDRRECGWLGCGRPGCERTCAGTPLTHGDSEDVPPVFDRTVKFGPTELRQRHPEWLGYRARDTDERVRLAIAQAGFDPAEFDVEFELRMTYTPKPGAR